MINVAAIGSVKNWPPIAEYGFASVFFLLFSTLIFFIPVSLVSAELATAWPKTGGVFVWVKEAFGHRAGFLAIWLLWLESVFWYPTILSFIAATIAYVINPELASNKTFMVTMILVLFWGSTFANIFGMKMSGWISTVGVLLGTLLPGILIIGLGLAWFFQGRPLQMEVSWDAFFPDLTSSDQLIFFIGILVSLAGMEMSAVHARDVKHPGKDYPKAALFAVLIILIFSILGVLSISAVIPQKQISFVAGSLQAFAYFVDAYNLHALTPYIAGLIALGAFGSMSTWTAGPSKGLLAAAQSGDLPPYFRAVNKHQMPANLLVAQALIVSLFSLMFLLMPSVSSAFWILTVIVAQLYLVMYLMMFSAAIKLRYTRGSVERPFKIPGGKLGIWIVSALGMLSSLFAFIIGFFPPSQVEQGHYPLYFAVLAVGIFLGCLGPYLILLFKKPHWDKRLSHETHDSLFS
jgi:putative glutamate/gamma-aminobutyrate antiporter